MAASSTLVEVAAFLVTNAFGVIATGKMPSSPDVMTAVYEYPGEADDAGFGVAGTQWEHPRIQVVRRGAAEDYEGPRLWAEKIRQTLATVQAQTLSGTKYLMIRPLGAPFRLKDDADRRVLIACNFAIDKAPSRTA
jgi:hypothetical protein